MDQIDTGQEREQMDREYALRAALQHEPPLPYVGSCYNCAALLPDGVRFCDCDCRTDYERRQRAEVFHARA